MCRNYVQIAYEEQLKELKQERAYILTIVLFKLNKCRTFAPTCAKMISILVLFFLAA